MKISKRIFNYTFVIIFTIIFYLVGNYILKRVNFYDYISQKIIINIILIFESFLASMILKIVVLQYYYYRIKKFGEILKFKLLIYIILNFLFLFLSFSIFMVFFNYNKLRRDNFNKINFYLENTHSRITKIIEKNNLIIEGLLKKDINQLNKLKNFGLPEDFTIIYLSNNKNEIVISKEFKIKNEKFKRIFNTFDNNNKVILKNIDGVNYIFGNYNYKKIIVKPPQQIYQINNDLYYGYINFKEEYNMFRYSLILFLLFMILIFSPFLLLQIFFALYFINKINKPLKILLQKFNAIDFDEFPEDYDNFKTSDELYILLKRYNLMRKEIRKNVVYRQYKERYEVYKKVTSKIAHEIKNPLTPIAISAQLIQKKYPYEDEYKNYLTKKTEVILNNVNFIRNTIEKLYNFAHTNSNSFKELDLIDFLKNVNTYWTSDKLSILINFNISEDTHLTIKADPEELHSIFNNLIINSINAGSTIGLEKIKIVINVNKERNSIVIDYFDNGPGVEKEIQKLIFEPFFSTSPKGTGLGLSIIKSILEKYNGYIEYIDDSAGAHFRISIKEDEGKNNGK